MEQALERWRALPRAGRIAAGVAAAYIGWLLVDNILPRGFPPGIVLLGLVFGSLYALVAVGIVLIYRANRVVNFAQAEMGGVAAIVTLELVRLWRWNYFLAIITGLIVAALTGAIIDIAVIRRLRRAPRLIVAVATIGLAQILTGLAVILPLILERGLAAGSFETPFEVRVEIFPLLFSGNHLMAILAVPAVTIALVSFLRYTDYGIAIRASAENGDRSSLLGMPINRLSTIVWSVSGVLSATAVILRLPILGFSSLGNITGGGNALFLRTLAAAVIGRMDNIPRTVAAALGLALFQEAAQWTFSNTVFVDAILVGVILVALLTQRQAFSRLTETSTWQMIREVRPIPAELRNLPEVRGGLWTLRIAIAVFAIGLPVIASPSQEQLAALILIYSVVAVSLLVVTGWIGQISLGHFALVGVGGATTALLYGRHGWDFFLAMPAGVVVAGVVALLIGLPALSVKGPFLAVTTLAFAVSASTFFLDRTQVPWFIEQTIERPALWGKVVLERDWQLYYLCLVVLVIVMASVKRLRDSRSGRAFIAIRDNEPAAQSVSLDITRMKLAAFVISGALAGIAGSLYVIHQNGLKTGAFTASVGLRIFSMVVIGGLGSLPGAVAGALFIRSAEFFLPGGWSFIVSGAGIVILLLTVPGGIGELIYRARDATLRWVARRRELIVPSLLADVRVPDEELFAGATGDDSSGAATVAGSSAGADADATTTLAPVRDGPPALLRVRGLDVAYGNVQVLFGVEMDVYDGEIVALLGTNGAGKSTVLRAVSGLIAPRAGHVRFDGQDVTGRKPESVAAAGIVQMPGGRGVFPSLTVAENLRAAGWLYRSDKAYLTSATAEVLEIFPILRERADQPAANLSGGEQQMLSLAQAFIAKPKLLLIDELSLGLAPAVVDTLLETVQAIHDRGTTVVIVEQSVHTALKIAKRAVFLEKGEVRFEGPTNELLDRPDVLRAVFLQGAAAAQQDSEATEATPPRRGRSRAKAAGGDDGRIAPGQDVRPVLRVEAIRKQFGGILAVNGVDLGVREGEILGLIGPNGAGKTTLFDLISGFLEADGGSVVLGDTDVTAWSAQQRAAAGLGRSFQDARLWPSLTVRETIGVALERRVAVRSPVHAMFGLPIVEASEEEIRHRTEELIELLGLSAFRDKFVSELSTGSRRIVEIATLLAHEPKVLLLDEPSSGIAQRETEALGPLLRRVQERLSCSLLIIEHDMPLITTLADRIIALDQGTVIASGTPDEVTRDPRVVESYLGSLAAELGRPPARRRRTRSTTRRAAAGSKSAGRTARAARAKSSSDAKPSRSGSTAASSSRKASSSGASPRKSSSKTSSSQKASSQKASSQKASSKTSSGESSRRGSKPAPRPRARKKPPSG